MEAAVAKGREDIYPLITEVDATYYLDTYTACRNIFYGDTEFHLVSLSE